MIQFWRITGTTVGARARVITAQMRGAGQEGDDDATAQGDDPTAADSTARTESYDGAEVLQPLGLMARPVITERIEGACIQIGDEWVVMHLVDKSGGGGASAVPFSDLAEGETRVYGAKEAAAKLRLRETGAVQLESKAGQGITITQLGGGAVISISSAGAIAITAPAGQDVVVNSGTLKAARVTDPVRIGAITGTAGPYPVVFSTVLNDADGTPGAPVVGATATISGVISNAGGAARVKLGTT